MIDESPLRSEWVEEKAIYTNDTLLIKDFQVMQDWETPYMKRLAEIATSKGGRILELGFGLGISAGFIQESEIITEHVIIEAHPDVIKFAKRKFPEASNSGRMNIKPGFWEDVSKKLEGDSFDGILFDTSPLNQETNFFHYFPFFSEAHRLLKGGGVFTYFSDEKDSMSEKHMHLLHDVGFYDIKYEIINVQPPAECRYWRYNTIVAPIVHK